MNIINNKIIRIESANDVLSPDIYMAKKYIEKNIIEKNLLELISILK